MKKYRNRDWCLYPQGNIFMWVQKKTLMHSFESYNRLKVHLKLS